MHPVIVALPMLSHLPAVCALQSTSCCCPQFVYSSPTGLPLPTHASFPSPFPVPSLWLSCCPISLPWVGPLPLCCAAAEPAPAQPGTAASQEHPCVLSSLMQTCAAVRIPLFSHLPANICCSAGASSAFPLLNSHLSCSIWSHPGCAHCI